jgi:hypothetical protein
MLRIPHCLDSRLTDGSEVVIPTHRPRSAPQKHNNNNNRLIPVTTRSLFVWAKDEMGGPCSTNGGEEERL